MRPQNPKALLLICAVFLCACKEELGFEEGYDDGYAVGYNTTCEIRTTAVHGAWDNKAYKSGFDDGYSDGAADCRAERN